MSTKRLAVLGGGFAGVWAGAAAAALRSDHGKSSELEIVLVSNRPRLTNRPRLYERRPANVTIPLRPITDAIGAELVLGEVTVIDDDGELVHLSGETEPLKVDGVVLALGSQVARPSVPGLAEYGHDVDTLAGAAAFWSAVEGAWGGDAETVVMVVGAGLTGIELAAELASVDGVRAVLVDPGAGLGDAFSSDAAPVITEALEDCGVDCEFGSAVACVEADAVVLEGGRVIEADVVVWTAGMRAHPLAATLGVASDEKGRLVTDECLAVPGLQRVHAAGDVAFAKPDGVHTAPMSCQFATPTGIIAGHNAAARLLGIQPEPLEMSRYVTCIDLGKWGALFTQGWEGMPVMTGDQGKQMKRRITHELIHPVADRETLFASARPAVVRDQRTG